MSVRVVVADDQALFRDGLVALIGTSADIEVVGIARDGAEAVEVAVRLRPDLVLMDLRMPHTDGVTATRMLRDRLGSTARVLMLTTFEDDASIRRALDAGAVGYLLKDVSRERLIESIHAAARGEAPLSDRVGARIVSWLGTGSPADPLAALGLSPRERSVLESLCRGMSNKEIASALQVSEGTVKNHLTRVFEKLGVEDRTQAALRAVELGLAPPERT